jgi:hypothetical protein
MISSSQLVVHAIEFIGTVITFVASWALVQWLNERQRMKAMRLKKLEDPSEPEVPEVAEEPIAESPQEEVQEVPKPIQKESKAKKGKREKKALAPKVEESVHETENPEHQQSPKVVDCINETLNETLNDTVVDRSIEKEEKEEIMDSGFHEVMPSKKAAREEARRRNKVKESERKPQLQAKVVSTTQAKVVATAEAPMEKPKPHCPPPSFVPQLKPQPHCPPPSFAPAPIEETQKETVQQTLKLKLAPVEASQKEIAQQQQAKESEATQPPPKQMTPREKEILNLGKKVREIEKLMEMKDAGITLEKKQEEKIARAGDIGLKLSQLYSERFLQEQKSTPAGDIEKPRQEASGMDIKTIEHILTEGPQKKQANKKKKEKSTHAPVVVPPRVVPPRVQTQPAIQPSMAPPGTWAPVIELPVEPAAQQEGEESEDFEMTPLDVEMTPLDVPESWKCQLSAHFEFCNPAPQFDAAVKDPICEVAEGQRGRKDDCWEWVTKGMCPRGEYCRWNHRPFGNGASEASVFALNLGDESDSD